MSENSAAGRFWLELEALYQAAGRPTLLALVRLGREQHPPISISASAINSWLNRKAVPAGHKNTRYLTVMVAFLQAGVRPGSQYARLSAGQWGRLLCAAQAERAAGKRQGRPRRPDVLPRDVSARIPHAGGKARGHVRAAPVPGGVRLVGRHGELAMLAGLAEQVAAGQGGVVLVEGEAGIGKSALVQASVTAAATLGCQVFWGTASELDQALPLQPLLDGLRVREPLADPRREVIARLLRGEVAMDRGIDGSAVLAEQVLALIAEECAGRATILVIDDLQWADQASIRLLARLAGAARDLPLLLVGMIRPVPQRDEVRILRRAAGLAARLPLAGLGSPAVAEMVAGLAGGTPDDRLLSLAGDAAGNPLYITELVEVMIRSSRVTISSDGVAALTAGPVPRSLVAAIADRIDFISGPAREALRTASLLGVEFTVTDLATLLDRSVASLAGNLREACAAGVLTESGGHLRFRHPLIRAALYEETPAVVRAAWHREAARALAAAGTPADRVARQLLRAISGTTADALAAGETSDGETADGPVSATGHSHVLTGAASVDALAVAPMDEWVLNWLTGSADLLVGQAPQVAADLLSQAVANTATRAANYAWFASRLADALYRLGDRAAAEQVANTALEQGGEADPNVLVDLHWTLAQCRMLAGLSNESLATLDQALGSAGLSSRHRARLLVLAARTHYSLGQMDMADRVGADGLAEATMANDAWAMGWALLVMALVDMVRGQLAEALPLYDRALVVTQADPALTDLRLLLSINKAAALGNLDRYDEALAVAGQARRLADQVGTPFRSSQAHCTLGQAQFETGRWDEALAEMSVMPEDLKEPGDACCELGIAAVIGFHRNDIDKARRNLAASGPHAKRIGQRLIPPLALARSLEREHAGALSTALAELTAWFDGSSEELGQAEDLVADAVRLAIKTDDRDAAQRLAKHAAEFAENSQIPHRHANALYCSGLVEHDPHKLLAAAQRYLDASRPLLMAKALEAAAEEFVAIDDRAAAREAMGRAVEAYAGLGAQADVNRVQAALRAGK